MRPTVIPIPIGTRYGQLTVNEYSHGPFWRVTCDCGKQILVPGSKLRRGNYVSCGCYKRLRKLTHGMSRSPTFSIWADMLRRCTSPKSKSYEYYGGRGITVCERWTRFEHFLSDMGERPAGMTLERADNEKGYSPNNCLWATRLVQANNRRTARIIEMDGQRLTLAQWSRVLGVPAYLIRQRLNHGWSVRDALTAPIRSNKGKPRKKSKSRY